MTGQSSGVHSGSLLSYSGHRGASFVPDQPLTQGESVAVVLRIRGRKPIRFGFTVATLGAKQGPLTLTATQPDKLQHFVSEPGLIPPKITINKSSKRARGNGKVLLTPLPSPVVHPESNNTVTIKPVGPGGPMIVDGGGNLVWFRQLAPPEVATNLRLQTFKGRKVLTWWEGTVTPSAYGIGGGVIANRSYRIVKVVHSGNGYPMDLHEFELTRDGDALFTIYSPIRVHLPGTPPGTLSPLLDAIVQEVDIKTGLVVWEWHSYGHIPLETSQATPQNSAFVRRLPHQRDPGGEEGSRVDLRARHISDLQGRPGERPDPLDARRQGAATSGSGPAPSSTSSTTPACCGTAGSACSTTGRARRSSTRSPAG